ncbi:hypothetical protein TNCV_2585001 [Trichonephila clavipes]|nr:hypothetical protein TNCV_2585001 [Trichonephila clavipes]
MSLKPYPLAPSSPPIRKLPFNPGLSTSRPKYISMWDGERLPEKTSSREANSLPEVTPPLLLSLLCKKANGAMKMSSVEFISRSPNPLPMKSEHRRFVLLRKIFQPWQWKRRKREIVLNRRPELYRGKYRCVQPKINLLKKTFLCL